MGSQKVPGKVILHFYVNTYINVYFIIIIIIIITGTTALC
jgi:hypothetical protein